MATGRGRLVQQHCRGLRALRWPLGGGGAAPGRAGFRKEPSVKGAAGRTALQQYARWEKDCEKPPTNCSVSLDRMPPEILLKIFSYLDAATLLCTGCVNRRFYHLANDNFIWIRIYSTAFSPKRFNWEVHSVEKTAVSVSLLSVEDKEAGYWKKEYITKQTVSVKAALAEVLRPVNPYTGLSAKTQEALRISGLGWVIILKEKSGKEHVLKHVDLSINYASATAVWYGKHWPRLATLSGLDLCGVMPVFMHRRKTPSKNGPRWHSLIAEYNLSDLTGSTMIGCDGLIRIFCLNPGLLVGLWKREEELAFVMANLHFHHLVERSALGSATVPYEPPPHSPLLDDSPEYGLHDYQLHVDMHSSGISYLSGTFRSLCTKKDYDNMVSRQTNVSILSLPLNNAVTLGKISSLLPADPAKWQESCWPGRVSVIWHWLLHLGRVGRSSTVLANYLGEGYIENGYVKLVVISFKNNTEHIPLIGKLGLFWRTDVFDGYIKSCSILDVTLLDEYGKPFWCFSSPVCVRSPRSSDSPDFLGQTYNVNYMDAEGKVCMELVWIEETEEYFVVSLVLYLSVAKVNRWFGTKY